MRNPCYYSLNSLVALACAALATLFLIACEQGQRAPEPRTASTDVYVIFEGPWAIVPDPKDPNSILAVAPKTKSHRLLAVTPAGTTLDAGIYDLSVPPHGTAGALDADKSFLRASIEAKNVQRVLDDKMERYAIRLPKPEAYRAETRYESRVGSTYPPDASTQQNYVTAVALLYRVSSKAGFSLAGAPDVGPSFNPLLLSLDTPAVRFALDPEANAADACNTHSRTAFRDLVRLLGVTLYVDFPENSSDCHKTDPQLAGSQKAGVVWDLSGQKLPPVQMASMGAGLFRVYLDRGAAQLERRLSAAMYFFHSDYGACLAPVVFGT
jgi:hypothetical protein